jgi:hypothetical protein
VGCETVEVIGIKDGIRERKRDATTTILKLEKREISSAQTLGATSPTSDAGRTPSWYCAWQQLCNS